MKSAALTQHQYLKGSYREGLHTESGITYLCFTPPRINGRRLLISESIQSLCQQAEQVLADYKNIQQPSNSFRIYDSTAEARGGPREINNYHATKHMLTGALTGQPLTMELVCKAHRLLLDGVRGEDKKPGTIRQRVSRVLNIDTMEVAFVPPHHDSLPPLLYDLEKFWANESLAMPPLVRIAIAQLQFLTIHPFNDGNGRISRIISEILIWRYGLTSYPQISLQTYFESNRREYHGALQAARQSAKAKRIYPWILFFLQGILDLDASHPG